MSNKKFIAQTQLDWKLKYFHSRLKLTSMILYNFFWYSISVSYSINDFSNNTNSIVILYTDYNHSIANNID